MRFPVLIWLSLMVLSAPAAPADWALDDAQSSLSFVSLKNVDVAEAHRFTGLSGTIAADGAFELAIRADSVDTKIPIRDERLREHVLQADRYPFARVRGRVDMGPVEGLEVGAATELEVRAELQLRDQVTPLAIPVQVSRVAGDALQAVSLAPILLSAGTLGVADGVEALREIAGLESISLAVPVYFSLRFERRAD